MPVAHPGNIKSNHAASHPSPSARMAALNAAVAEIKAKQLAKLELVANKNEAPMAQVSTE